MAGWLEVFLRQVGANQPTIFIAIYDIYCVYTRYKYSELNKGTNHNYTSNPFIPNASVHM